MHQLVVKTWSGAGARGRRREDERGAALVEFALVLPLFFMLLLAMFSGGLAWNVKLSVTQATREAARTAATLPRTGTTSDWLAQVTDIAMRSADGDLDVSRSGRSVCVAYVSGTETVRRIEDVNGSAVVEPGLPCYSDGLTTGQPRVQVVGVRSARLEALVFARDLSLEARAVSRIEVVGP